MPPTIERQACPICGHAASSIGTRTSSYSSIVFRFARCDECAYAFVCNPRVDFAALYDAEYYAGRGADPSVRYSVDMSDAHTTRIYEWHGIAEIVRNITDVDRTTRWLDYGCGLGGLITSVRAFASCDIVGFDEGYAVEQLGRSGIPHLTRDELGQRAGTFDVVTAIEVLEHVLDPLDVLREIHALLAPGGVLFLTTGNAEPHRRKLLRWSYTAVPDVHIGFFEPRTLAGALEDAGFEVFWPGWVDGLDGVIRYKVLKSLRLGSTSLLERALPWSLLARVVDARHHVSAMPAARRPR